MPLKENITEIIASNKSVEIVYACTRNLKSRRTVSKWQYVYPKVSC